MAVHRRIGRRDRAHHRPSATRARRGRARDRRPRRVRTRLRTQGSVRRGPARGAGRRAGVHARTLHERDRAAVILRGDRGGRGARRGDGRAHAHLPSQQQQHSGHSAHRGAVAQRESEWSPHLHRGVPVRRRIHGRRRRALPRQLARAVRRRDGRRHRARRSSVHRLHPRRRAGEGARDVGGRAFPPPRSQRRGSGLSRPVHPIPRRRDRLRRHAVDLAGAPDHGRRVAPA